MRPIGIPVSVALVACFLSLGSPSALAAPREPSVISGRATTIGAPQPLTSGAVLLPGAIVDVPKMLVVRMPDGTIARLFAGSETTFDGVLDEQTYSLHIARGEIDLDASQRDPRATALRYELRTPLHTIVSFRATKGVVIVDANRDRIACERCGRGDFLVRSFDKEIALSQPGQAAVVMAEGGLLGGVLPGELTQFDAATVRNDWVIRSIAVTVRLENGDRPSMSRVCPGLPVALQVVGGRPPFAITIADATAATVRPTTSPRAFELMVTGAMQLTIVDPDRRSATVDIHAVAAPPCSMTLPPRPS